MDIGALVESMRRIHAEQDATPLQRARWYALEPIGWARHQWHTRRRRHPISRAYLKLQRTLGVRAWKPGDSTVRLALTEPWEFPPSYVWGRFQCRTRGRHNTTCRGRIDCQALLRRTQ
ncbi:hypothetical protein [Thermomonospora amylolytica]|uniref:hypothetical protein n=1 Tax=Thermomonospora amylolytica TaxID=1411117 RepID=UPI000E6C39BA|nr:hypothetical protein [Thermomonospora amylolytica]